jgi:ppGpp synthetase/RelA/SpoT-type nucleotidyltranferase
MNLGEILEKWEKDKPMYKAYESKAFQVLDYELKQSGVVARISSRVKDNVSLAKKLIKKGVSNKSYNEINDRVGIRVVCKFRTDLSTVSEIIRRCFEVIKEEDKASLLMINEIGYKSFHFDCIVPKSSGSAGELYEEIIGEIQVRTMCEDVWSELAHDIAYKPLSGLPDDIARQIFCIGGLLEVADDSIDRIYLSAADNIIVEPWTVSNLLESLYITLFPGVYDKELSAQLLADLLKTFKDWNFERFEQTLSAYTTKNKDKIIRVLKERKKKLPLFPFVTQPEFLLIIYMMDNCPHELSKNWSSIYPDEDLEVVSIWWGKPMAEYNSAE